MNKPPRISEAEWQVMKAVWRQPGCTAQQVIDALAPTTDWGPATVKTLLNRLLRKRALEFEKIGKAYLYSPAFSKNDFRAAEADSFVERVFDGALSPMISHFAKSRRLGKADLEELRKILREGKKTP